MVDKANQILGLPEGSTEEQALAAITALKAEVSGFLRAKYKGHLLSAATRAGVDRRVAAGLYMEQAIEAQLAQEAHDGGGR